MKQKLYAHRGNIGSINSSDNYVDNSLQNIMIASRADYINGIELDVVMTKDKKFVVVHNTTLKEITSNKDRRCIENLTLEELKKIAILENKKYYSVLYARSFFLKDGFNLRKIIAEKMMRTSEMSSLEEVLNDLSTDKEIIIELKNGNREKATILSQIINRYSDKLNLQFHGYNPVASIIVKKLTGIPVGIVANHLTYKKLERELLSSDIFDFYSLLWLLVLDKNFINKVIETKKNINFWTIDSKNHYEILRRMLGNKMEEIGIISNVPERIKHYYNK